MIHSPLHLKNYFVTKLNIAANQSADLSKQPEELASMNTKVQTAKHADDERKWRVSLCLSCSPTEKQFSPYSFEVELVGYFEVDNGFPDEKVRDLVTANAPAVLYGAARELILLVTGRGPFPPYCLPSATFIDHISSKKETKSKQIVPA